MQRRLLGQKRVAQANHPSLRKICQQDRRPVVPGKDRIKTAIAKHHAQPRLDPPSQSAIIPVEKEVIRLRILDKQTPLDRKLQQDSPIGQKLRLNLRTPRENKSKRLAAVILNKEE
jgi:hypothetical protein